MTDFDLEECLCSEGQARKITKSQAHAFNFCGNEMDGFCPKWSECHDDKSKKVEPLIWYTAGIRIHWKWVYYDILAYSEEQAKKLVKDEVGYHVVMGKDDFVIKKVRELKRSETLHYKTCRIKEKV